MKPTEKTLLLHRIRLWFISLFLATDNFPKQITNIKNISL